MSHAAMASVSTALAEPCQGSALAWSSPCSGPWCVHSWDGGDFSKPEALARGWGPASLKEQGIGCLGSGWVKLVEICLPLDLAVALILQPVVGWVPC